LAEGLLSQEELSGSEIHAMVGVDVQTSTPNPAEGASEQRRSEEDAHPVGTVS